MVAWGCTELGPQPTEAFTAIQPTQVDTRGLTNTHKGVFVVMLTHAYTYVFRNRSSEHTEPRTYRSEAELHRPKGH